MPFKKPIEALADRAKRRIELVVGVADNTDLERARDTIHDAFAGLGTVDAQHRIGVFVRGFGASSVDFFVRWSTGSTPIEAHRSRDELAVTIKASLDAAGIEIPFPQRTLTVSEPLRLAREPGNGR